MSHDPATCPAFGGCSDCRSAKFEAASPDPWIEVDRPTEAVPNVAVPTWTRPADPEAEDTWTQLEPWEPRADPVDYAGVPAFTAAADPSLARAGAIYNQRGSEYGDSWALENIVTTYLDVVLDRLGIFGLSLAAKRLLESASIVDVKESRIKNGPWKLDNSDDGINYRAAFSTWHTEYEEEQ